MPGSAGIGDANGHLPHDTRHGHVDAWVSDHCTSSVRRKHPAAPSCCLRYAITALTPMSSIPARFVSPEILDNLFKQCPLIVTTCEVDAMDTKPLTVLEALHIAYRYAITALTIGSIVYVASTLSCSLWATLSSMTFPSQLLRC
jgi:hypothetical protein